MIRLARFLDLDGLHLEHGSHEPDSTFCVMEAVAYVAGEEWTDMPACASPVLAKYCQGLNDAMDDEARQLLKPYIPRLAQSRDDGRELERCFQLADRAVRVFLPLALDAIDLPAEAARLRALPAVIDASSAAGAWSAADAARSAAHAARSAAEAAGSAAAAAGSAAHAARSAAHAARSAADAARSAADAARSAAEAAGSAAHAAWAEALQLLDDLLAPAAEVAS